MGGDCGAGEVPALGRAAPRSGAGSQRLAVEAETPRAGAELAFWTGDAGAPFAAAGRRARSIRRAMLRRHGRPS